MIISIRNKYYDVKIAESEEEKLKGLLGIKNLPQDLGMLFIYDYPQTVGFWMKDTLIPLDIIFINENLKVISIYKGIPEDETIVEEDNVMYVLELNLNSGILEGDELNLDVEEEEVEDDEDIPTMKVIRSDGSVQMELKGGERIFSRKNTKTLIKMAKKADTTKKDSDYKRLGKKMFTYIRTQDTQEPEYVTK